MLHKDKVYKKKLRINHLLKSNTLGLNNSALKILQNPEKQSSSLCIEKELIDQSNLTFLKSKSFNKEPHTKNSPNNPTTQNEQTRIIYKQINSLGNLFSKTQQSKNSPNPKKREQVESTAFLIDPLRKQKQKNKFFHAKNLQSKMINKLQQPLKRYSSQNDSSENLSFQNLPMKEKSATYRHEEIDLGFVHQKMIQKRDFSIQNDECQSFIRQQLQAKSLTKITSILNLKPKQDRKGKKTIKTTAMGKYDVGYQNMRLASKILSMKPTKFCDIKEQKKFYKKQLYFKQIRSRTIEMNDKAHLNEINQSISFPKINERYHMTVQ